MCCRINLGKHYKGTKGTGNKCQINRGRINRIPYKFEVLGILFKENCYSLMACNYCAVSCIKLYYDVMSSDRHTAVDKSIGHIRVLLSIVRLGRDDSDIKSKCYFVLHHQPKMLYSGYILKLNIGLYIHLCYCELLIIFFRKTGVFIWLNCNLTSIFRIEN